jgi:hypothetical protein
VIRLTKGSIPFSKGQPCGRRAKTFHQMDDLHADYICATGS